MNEYNWCSFLIDMDVHLLSSLSHKFPKNIAVFSISLRCNNIRLLSIEEFCVVVHCYYSTTIMDITYNIDYFTDSIVASVNANSPQAIVRLRQIFVFSVGCFVLFCPFYRSRKSWFDAIAANKMITILRILISVEVLACLLLLYFSMSLGSPLALHELTSFGNGNGSWLYGWGRPLAGIFLIGVGTMGDMHPLPRLTCVLGVFMEMVGDMLSAYQIGDYIQQTNALGAPLEGQYSKLALVIYYYRDLISFGLCVWIMLLNFLFIITVGVCNPPFFRYQVIAGGDFDRCEVMRRERAAEKAHQERKDHEHDERQVRRNKGFEVDSPRATFAVTGTVFDI